VFGFVLYIVIQGLNHKSGPKKEFLMNPLERKETSTRIAVSTPTQGRGGSSVREMMCIRLRPEQDNSNATDCLAKRAMCDLF